MQFGRQVFCFTSLMKACYIKEYQSAWSAASSIFAKMLNQIGDGEYHSCRKVLYCLYPGANEAGVLVPGG